MPFWLPKSNVWLCVYRRSHTSTSIMDDPPSSPRHQTYVTTVDGPNSVTIQRWLRAGGLVAKVRSRGHVLSNRDSAAEIAAGNYGWDQSQLYYFHLARTGRRRYHRYSKNTTEPHEIWRTLAMEYSRKICCRRNWSRQQLPNARISQGIWNNVNGVQCRCRCCSYT